ncbi:MAG: hypothetical protein KC503_08755 [Myxococcales bacterium]|nr:hypothetical protein [Myxococcales bacterium]
MKETRLTTALAAAVLVTFALATAHAAPEVEVNGRIIEQSLTKSRVGYTILSVWGTHYEMGFAHGALLARDVLFAVEEARTVFAKVYDRGRERVKTYVFEPRGILDELRGIVDGVKHVLPDADITVTDLEIINTIADWLYPPGCNSHSSWGSRVKAPVRALHSRRLDTPLVLKSDAVKHHVLIARAATAGEPVRWLNVAWPGYVLSLTGVNEHGVLASLHDLATDMHSKPGNGYLARMVANRLVLTAVDGVPLARQLDFVYQLLRRYTIATGGFINWYAPDGYGGVITCLAGQRCSKKRVPQPEFHDGEVLITTNFETDGKSAPEWGEYIDAFYAEGGAHTMQQHLDVLLGGKAFSPPTHALSVAYRARGDMTLRFVGTIDNDGTMTEPKDFEFKDLFEPQTPTPVAAGVPKTPASQRNPDGLVPSDEPSGGCAVPPGSTNSTSSLLLLLLALGVTLRSATRRN